MKSSISLVAVVCVLCCAVSAKAGGPKGGHSMSSGSSMSSSMGSSKALLAKPVNTINRVPVNTTILGSSSQSLSPEKGHGPVVLNPVTTVNGSPEKGHGPVVLNPTKPCQPTCGKDKCHRDFCNWFWYMNCCYGGCGGDYCYDNCCYDDCDSGCCYYW
jgi:hypothetical protein